MSWAFGVESGPASGFATRAPASAEAWKAAHPAEYTAEVATQIACCIAAAAAMMPGVTGADDDVAASFSGHANPGHVAPAGMSPDTLNVSLYRRAATPPPL